MTILLIALIGLLLSVAYGFVGNRLMQHGRFGFKPRFFEFAFFYGVVAFFWLFGAPERVIIVIVGSGLVTMVTMYLGNPERPIAIGYTDPWSAFHTLACVVYVVTIIYGGVFWGHHIYFRPTEQSVRIFLLSRENSETVWN